MISIKLSTTFLLWGSQIIPLIRSLDIYHYIVANERPAKKILNKKEDKISNPNYQIWVTNDGLLTSWLLGSMEEDVFSMVFEEAGTTFDYGFHLNNNYFLSQLKMKETWNVYWWESRRVHIQLKNTLKNSNLFVISQFQTLIRFFNLQENWETSIWIFIQLYWQKLHIHSSISLP